MNSGELIKSTSVLVIIIAIFAQRYSAIKEFQDPHQVRNWVRKSIMLYAVVFFGSLMLGNSGVLSNFEKFPPPMMGFFTAMILTSFFLAFSKFGTLLVKHIPLYALVLFQSFRILAELAIHLGVKEGIAPIQLSVHGYNFDIVTGVSALAVGFYLRKFENRKVAYAWNIMGVCFLAVIAFIALTSFPVPFRVFMNEPSNIWVTHSPHILLPAILVTAALTAHLISFRKLNSI